MRLLSLGLSLGLLVSASSHADRGPMTQVRWVDELIGPSPSLPPTLGRLGLGARVADLKSLAPALRAVPPWPTFASVVTSGYAAASIPGTFHFITRPGHDTIEAIALVLRPGDGARALEAIRARWGRPLHITSQEAHHQDVAAGIRTIVEGGPATAVIVNYVPVVRTEQLLGTERGRLGFERRSLIGAALADVPSLLAKLPGVRVEDGAPTSIAFPRLDTSAFAASATLVVKGDKVVGYRLQLPFEWRPDRRQVLLDNLATSFGPAKRAPSLVTYPGPPAVAVDLGQDGQLLIHVGARD